MSLLAYTDKRLSHLANSPCLRRFKSLSGHRLQVQPVAMLTWFTLGGRNPSRPLCELSRPSQATVNMIYAVSIKAMPFVVIHRLKTCLDVLFRPWTLPVLPWIPYFLAISSNRPYSVNDWHYSARLSMIRPIPFVSKKGSSSFSNISHSAGREGDHATYLAQAMPEAIHTVFISPAFFLWYLLSVCISRPIWWNPMKSLKAFLNGSNFGPWNAPWIETMKNWVSSSANSRRSSSVSSILSLVMSFSFSAKEILSPIEFSWDLESTHSKYFLTKELA